MSTVDAMQHVRRFTAVLLILLAAYGLYAVAVAPWVEPAPLTRERPSISEASFPTAEPRNFSVFFEPGSWELDNPMVVETADATLLLQNYAPLPDGKMELKPCTIIFYVAAKAAGGAPPPRGDSRAGKRPMVMRAPQGAVLEFDRPVDFAKAEFGKLMGGKLNGAVDVFSPASRPGADDALQVKTRNVVFNKDEIKTPHEVDFRYGGSFGRGRDLQITLLPGNPAPGSRQGPGIGGVSVLTLNHVERLHLEGASGMLGAGPPTAPGTPAFANKPPEPPLEVHCQGPLIVDFDQQVVALDDQVEVSRVYPQGQPDRLQCSRLVFYLVQKKNASPEPAKPSKLTGDPAMAPVGGDRLAETVEKIVALGNPVILDAPQSATYAKAVHVEYITATRRLSLNSGQDLPQVTLKFQRNQFQARELEYEMAAEPGRLGRLWAAGPGRLEAVPGDGPRRQTVVATWQKELRIRPQGKNQVVSLIDGATIKVEATGDFQANELHLWLLEVAESAAALAGAPPLRRVSAAEPTAKQQPRWTIVPDRLLALGDVQCDSPQLKAKTPRLEAWFAYKPLVDATRAAGAEPPAATIAGGNGPPASGNPPADAVAAPADAAVTSGEPARPTSPPAVRKFDVEGDLVQIQVLRWGTQTAIEDLSITGKVRVEEIHTVLPNEVPLKIRGDAVTLRGGSTPDAKVAVLGKPAQVSARGLSLTGAAIHLHRGDNRLWIEGAGDATLPLPEDKVEADAAPRGPRIDPPVDAAPRQVYIRWQRGMEFDGLVARFQGQVDARSQGRFAAAGDSLEVTINQKIDFSQQKKSGPLEMVRLALDGGGKAATLQNIGLDLQGRQSSLDNMIVRSVTIDRARGTIHADGPGEVWSVRQGGQIGPAAPTASAANPDQLSYVCVKFAGEILGNIDKREISFHRQVETTYGPVQEWNQRIVATKLADLGESGALLHCDALRVTEWQVGAGKEGAVRKWVELDATGNTLVEGKSYVARGERVSYNSEKDQIILAGDGRNDAEFWHQKRPGARHSYTKATKITFNRRLNSIIMDGAQTLDLGSLPEGKTPAPKIIR